MKITGEVATEASIEVEQGVGEQLFLVAKIGQQLSDIIAMVRARYGDNRLQLTVYKADAERLGIEVVIIDYDTERS